MENGRSFREKEWNEQHTRDRLALDIKINGNARLVALTGLQCSMEVERL